LHALQEQTDEARPSLERALHELESLGAAETESREANARHRAMVMALSAQIAARQNRTEEAITWLDRAEALLPGHPALANIRGEALGNVWRWKEAMGPLREAAQAAPRDDQIWMHLALAAGSAGEPYGALEAARHALTLQPRDADCLRIQTLALESLSAPPADIARAERAYLDFRAPDDAPRIRALCSKTVPNCALERIPVHTHVLRRP